jgi:hypothetical protein
MSLVGGKGSLALVPVNDGNAPIPAIRGTAIEPPESTRSGHSRGCASSGADAPIWTFYLRLAEPFRGASQDAPFADGSFCFDSI